MITISFGLFGFDFSFSSYDKYLLGDVGLIVPEQEPKRLQRTHPVKNHFYYSRYRYRQKHTRYAPQFIPDQHNDNRNQRVDFYLGRHNLGYKKIIVDELHDEIGDQYIESVYWLFCGQGQQHRQGNSDHTADIGNDIQQRA